MDALRSITSFPVTTVSAAVLDGPSEWSIGDEEHVFALASVTKLLTAYAVLLAVEEGALELDTPLGPEGSTVRHLLAHASGVGFDSRQAQKPVGSRRIYSSAGYEILADAVAEATEMDFEAYLAEGVCAPLGMTATRLEGSAGHGAVSTVRDLVAFAREMLHPTILHPDTVAEALRPHFPEVRGVVPGYGMQKPCLWGLGPEIKGEKSPHWTGENMPADTAGHFGMSGTYLWLHQPSGRAMVMLSDRDFGEWAKPLWAETNAAIWTELSSSSSE